MSTDLNDETGLTVVSSDQTQPETEAEQSATTEAETVEQEAETEQEQEAEPKPKEKPWFVRRIEKERAQRQILERQLDIAQQLLEAAQTGGDGSEPVKTQAPTGAVDVETRAQQIVAQREFDAACNVAVDIGAKEFGADFNASLDTLKTMGVIGPTPEARTFVEAALETGKAHVVLNYLGQNPDEAERISSLTPLKMAVEMERIAAKGSTKPAQPISKAPPPVKPLTRAVATESDPEKMTADEWLKWRNSTKKIH